MLAIVFPRPNEFELLDVPEPLPAPDQVLVGVKATTICATDLKIFRGAVPLVKFPHIPGHEWGGEIVATGSQVSGLKPGDLVGVEAHVGCNACPRCAEGLYNLCENYGHAERGHAHIGFTVPGGLAEYCAIPVRAAHPMPEGLGADQAAFSDTVGIVLWAFERAGGVRGGETVAVLGPGALGLLAVQVARAQGAAEVIVIGAENDASRLALARQMGASHTLVASGRGDTLQAVRDLTGGRGVDLVIEFAGTAQAARGSLEIARRGGRVVLGGATSPGKHLEVDLSVIVRGHLDVYGTVANPRGITRRANLLMQSGQVDISALITHHLPLVEFPRAWEIFTKREDNAIRVMLHP